MRVSELCGRTRDQLDFEKQKIWVDHQLVRKADGTLYVEKTKTESGCRFIPMTDNVDAALKNILANRRNPGAEAGLSTTPILHQSVVQLWRVAEIYKSKKFEK